MLLAGQSNESWAGRQQQQAGVVLCQGVAAAVAVQAGKHCLGMIKLIQVGISAI